MPASLWVTGFRHIDELIRKHFEREDASIDDYIARAIEQSYEDPHGGEDDGKP